MSIGQRIAQKRKELGLSQEALGDRLGVSRQSIYKWESDSTLPEVEKLIALAKLFGVSVGWLLGVEEDAVPAPESSSGLTETQLEMVEEIVSRYIAALPKPKPRRRWPLVLAALVLLFSGWSLFSRLDQMDQQYNNLQNSVNNVTWSVNNQIGGISSRVEEILKSQNNLTAEYSTEVKYMDLQANSVTFSLRAVPKTYVEGMTAEFSVHNGNGANIKPVNPIHQTFSTDITCELTDSITLSVVFISPDGRRETQLLDTYEYLYTDSLPSVSLEDYNLMYAETPGGVLTLSELYITARQYDSPSAVSELKVGLFKNQKLLAWGEPCDKPDGFSAGFEDRDFYCLTDMTVTLTGEDQLAVAALVTDEYGRQVVITGDTPYVLDENAQNLTWADAFSSDTDPAHWQFD